MSLVRFLTACAVALCLTVSGGAVALTGGDVGTPALSSGKHSLGDVALVKPSLLKLQAGLSPDTPAEHASGRSRVPPPAALTLPVESVSAGLALGSITPAALVFFASHPTRAGP